jgi:hypothetical protein
MKMRTLATEEANQPPAAFLVGVGILVGDADAAWLGRVHLYGADR